MPRLRPGVRGVRDERAYRGLSGMPECEFEKAPLLARVRRGERRVADEGRRVSGGQLRRRRSQLRLPRGRDGLIGRWAGEAPVRHPPRLPAFIFRSAAAFPPRASSARSPAAPRMRSSRPCAPATFRAGGSVANPCRVLTCFFAVEVTPALREVCLADRLVGMCKGEACGVPIWRTIGFDDSDAALKRRASHDLIWTNELIWAE